MSRHTAALVSASQTIAASERRQRSVKPSLRHSVRDTDLRGDVELTMREVCEALMARGISEQNAFISINDAVNGFDSR